MTTPLSPISNLQSPVLEADPRELAQLGALSAPDSVDLASHTIHAFSSMRKAFVQMTGNEFTHAKEHFDAYLAAHNLTEAGALAEIVAAVPANLTDDQRADWVKKQKNLWEEKIQMAAVPNSLFHLTGLAFICVSDVAVLQKLMADRAAYEKAVLEWWEGLTEPQWQALTISATAALEKSNTGSDFTVEKESGAQVTKN